MIKSFRHKGLKAFYDTGDTSKISQIHAPRLRLILNYLSTATEVKNLYFPGSNLHRLRGDMKDYWSVKVSGNWRIIFRFEDGDIYDVDYVDYH